MYLLTSVFGTAVHQGQLQNRYLKVSAFEGKADPNECSMLRRLMTRCGHSLSSDRVVSSSCHQPVTYPPRFDSSCPSDLRHGARSRPSAGI